ncbi:hypothetical protein [Mycolicibacterium arenosum]|uniref:Lipoprotein n=1 Tax=Mycolicibacterium arenosum TaxID=2952157 RepID=A0ABT1M5X4_9MYCO|nr:hypothetical protein [Mycolicibacterium sp. CAU 1645]MCP9274222.1 hypothetical protein [Mycolicibacterium sp. CAU 1645]
MRAVLILAGLAMAGYGALLLWDNPWEVILNIGIWAAAGVVLHDFVFAPLCAAAGWAARPLVRGRLWRPVVVAATCSVVLVLLAVPVYSRPGARADNATVLDRNYPLGLWVSLAVVWACVPIYYLIVRLLPVREDEVVDQQRADDVQSEPPTV